MAAAGPQDHRALAGLEALTWERPVISNVENASAYKQRKVKKLVVISQARSGSVVEEDLLGEMKLNEPDGQVETGAAGYKHANV